MYIQISENTANRRKFVAIICFFHLKTQLSSKNLR